MCLLKETLKLQLPVFTVCCMALYVSVANRLHQLVALEGEYQPPPGFTPVIQDVINFLEKVWLCTCTVLVLALFLRLYHTLSNLSLNACLDWLFIFKNHGFSSFFFHENFWVY